MRNRAEEARSRLDQNTAHKSTTIRPTIYEAIIASNLAHHDKIPDRLAQEAFTLLAGGSATTARVLTYLTVHLAVNPDIRLRLVAQLEDLSLGLSESRSLEDLERLPYLVGCTPSHLLLLLSSIVMNYPIDSSGQRGAPCHIAHRVAYTARISYQATPLQRVGHTTQC